MADVNRLLDPGHCGHGTVMRADMDEFRCPYCKGALTAREDRYECAACEKMYPVILGIPDFRVFPDPYIDYEDDRQKAAYLVEQYDKLDFMGLVRLYWDMTPEVSKDRAERFIRRTAALVDKGHECLSLIESLAGGHRLQGCRRVLEIGCGTGGFLIAAKRKYESVIGADIAFRWLVVARKRLQELHIDVPLVCCCAEFLPFARKSFDIILAEDVLEHVRSQEQMLMECQRLMTARGVLFLATPNRFSVTAEPHVHVWGVGWLPRKWMNAYVRFMRGINYDQIRVLSFIELRTLLNNCRLENHRILLPSISPEEAKYFSLPRRMELALYNVVRSIPVVRWILYLIGPFFNVVVFADDKRREKPAKAA
jgi:2-polyprenyl-3-methyl-5-hydroxy-6-metoxy-1,4-benzoquinol methylase/uncharacterized protein YbaR (Trm112 family)